VHIFVGNLAFTATEQDVRQLFEPYGAVETIRLITDRDTGQPRGFGFIDMPDRREAQSAIAGLQGQEFVGRSLNVTEAKPREPRRDARRDPNRSRW
jgi:RNA recognition motif-containing protein